MKKALVLALLVGVSETTTFSQKRPSPKLAPTHPYSSETGTVAYYPTYQSSNQPVTGVTYYPTYTATAPAPTPQAKKLSFTMAIVWRGSLVTEFTINAGPGERYNLESSTDLKSWVEIERVFVGVSGQRVVRIPFDFSAQQKFFRLNR